MRARAISIFADEGARSVGFSEDEAGTRYAMFSISDAPDEQDRALGLDGLHFEVDAPENGGYDTVARIESDRAGLIVHGKSGEILRIDIDPAHSEAATALTALGDIADRAGIPFKKIDT